MSSNVTYKQLEAYFEVLRPSKAVLDLSLNKQTIFNKDEGGKRMIFYTGSVFNKDELAFIEKFEADHEELSLPAWWRTGDTLRFAHTVKFDLEKTKVLIREYLAYVQEAKDTKLSQETLGFIGSGNLYVSGKDKDECTNIYMTFAPKIGSVELSEYLGLVKFLLLLVRNMTAVPGYQERVNLFLNLVDRECSKAFMLHFLDRLRYILVRTFPFTVSKILFFGDLGDIEEKYEEFRKKMAPFCEVIHFKQSETSDLLEVIEVDQLENKFGGDKPDILEYWPPSHHTPPGQAIDEEDLGKIRVPPFFIFDEDYEKFRQEHMLTGVQVQKRIRPGKLKFKKIQGEQPVISVAKSTSETLNKGDNSYVELRKTSKNRNQTVSPSKRDEDDDKLETLTRESQLVRDTIKDDIVNYRDSRAFKAKHFASQKQAQKTKGKTSGFFTFLGCCDGR